MTSQISTTDWQSGKEFAETNLYMLDHEIACDVTFRVGAQQTTVRAHRFMLISRSHVLSAMLCGPMVETGEIEIPDVDAGISRLSLRFLYTNDITVKPNSVMHVLYLSKKYNTVNLHDQCLKFLDTSMTPENVCVILEQAKVFDEKTLYAKTMKFINKNGTSILKSPGFLDLSRESVLDVVKSDDLDIDEEDVFHAVNTWAERQWQKQGTAVTPEAKREALGLVVKHVRFPSLSQKFVVKTVDPSGVLTLPEQLGILHHFICPYRLPEGFSAEPRNHDKKEKTVYRFKTTNRIQWGKFDSDDAISFKCNKTIRLRGFMVYGPYSGKRESYDISARLMDENNTILTELNTTSQMDERKMFSVYFQHSAKVKPNTLHTICVWYVGPATWCGDANCVTESAHANIDDYQFDFVDSSFRKCAKHFTLTLQIPALIFTR
ncbi:BTB/POZ domain-containing protein 2-like [Gigantopelta aegis]|uniref:BTB/POZ domain-containing protein 2-like n=1 Tax=Gigantopelta aegis TaxID=1735272 RepID=UPI001B88C80E|nr:BTB/POZ domain-containing protein 2-like [Gigantopelta aegis]XP_041360725.1 BTB/POZ domain-containing protein 2-like [Gigantopelta aegis]